MALPLPEGIDILVQHRHLPANFEMPSLEVASDCYNLVYFISGDRRTITPTASYTLHPGYINLVAPFVYHRTVPISDQDYENILIKFSPKVIAPMEEALGKTFLEELSSQVATHFPPRVEERIKALVFQMVNLYEEKSPSAEYLLRTLLFELLLLLSREGLSDENSHHHTSTLSQEIMEAVYYMEKNYRKKLTLRETADHIGYSEAYFSRLFQNQLGHSFSDYLATIRIRRVQSLLLTTEKSITEIALESGFTYPGNMTSAFRKKVGMSPLQYRKEKKHA